jgi:26S proteasome regulatory subunit N7
MSDDSKTDEVKGAEEDDKEVTQDVVLQLAELRFALRLDKEDDVDDDETAANRKAFLELVRENSMVDAYKSACEAQYLHMDESVLTAIEAARDEAAAKIDEERKAALKQEGETEVYECDLRKARHSGLSADLQSGLDAYEGVEKLTSGKSIDRYLAMLRLCLAQGNDRLYLKYSESVAKLIDKAGDWDRRNRFRVYNGVHNFRVRKFADAAENFLSAIATFTAAEMFNYKRLVKYTIISAVVSLPRGDIKHKIIDSADIRQVIHDDDMADIRELVDALYQCRYRDLMRSLVEVMSFVRSDIHLSTHANYFMRQMRIRSYSQFLRSYLSVQLSSMAKEFGLSEEFLDNELSALIASGRLDCKMDKVKGVIEMKREASKSHKYAEAIRRGDILLNRVQRLSRVITY